MEPDESAADPKTWRRTQQPSMNSPQLAGPLNCKTQCLTIHSWLKRSLSELTEGGTSRSAAIRQAVLEAAARRERAAEMRHAVLRMPLGEPDGINIADELSWSRQEER